MPKFLKRNRGDREEIRNAEQYIPLRRISSEIEPVSQFLNEEPRFLQRLLRQEDETQNPPILERRSTIEDFDRFGPERASDQQPIYSVTSRYAGAKRMSMIRRHPDDDVTGEEDVYQVS